MSQISLFKVFMSEDVLKPVCDTLMSGFITQGPRVEEFENKIKEMFNYPWVLTLNSATSGLTIAMRLIKDYYNLDENSEVLSTPLTCMATNIPILGNGLKIKWVDVDKNTGLMDLDDLEKKINHNTKIITFVHWGGYPLDLDRLNEILDKKEKELGFRPYVIEDCAHAFLSEYKGKKIGTHGNFAVFSLQAIKHLTTADGGLIFLPNKEFYEKAKLLRWYGIDRDKRNYKKKDLRLEHDVTNWGYKFHMNDLNATIGIHNLPHIHDLIKKNYENGSYFNDQLKDVKEISIINKTDNSDYKSAFWLYTVLVDKKKEFIEYMKLNNVFVSQVHQRNDIHSCFKEFVTKLPNLDKVEMELVCIPVGWWLTQENKEHIVSLIKKFYNNS